MKTKLRTLFRILLICLPVNSNAQIISTFAGNGTSGYSDGGGVPVAAEFNHPWGLAKDGSGNLYIADHINSVIRKISDAGIISTYAGSGAFGYSGDGGSATCDCAKMKRPAGIAVDAYGNLYIADSADNRIRKVDTSNTIYTVAGNGAAGYSGDGGAGTAAALKAPTGVAVDDSGYLYIADFGNNVIRRVSPAGVISTFAGTGAPGYGGDGGNAATASFMNPINVAFDPSGNLFVADYSNNVIRRISKTGMITTFAGTGSGGFGGDNGMATASVLHGPNGLAFDAGELYFTDENNNRVRKVNSSGIVTTIAGNGNAGYTGDGGPATSAEFYLPMGVVSRNGNMYISDYINSVVREVIPDYAPSFVSRSVIFVPCPGSTANIDTALAVLDTNSGQRETWTVLTSPVHGTLGGFPVSAMSNGGILTPSGLTYAAAGGYTGIDSFIVQVSDGFSLTSGVVHIFINRLPMVINPGNQVLCNGSTSSTIVFSDSATGASFTWTNSNPGIGLSGSGAGNIPSFTAIDGTFLPVTSTVAVTPFANACVGVAQSFTITVNPTPNVNAVANQTLCNGTITAPVNFSGVVARTVFNWTNNNLGIGLAASGSGNISSFMATNSTSFSESATINAMPVANGCIGQNQDFTIIVNASPSPADITLADNSVCTDVYFRNFGAANLAPPGMVYSWTAANAGISDVGSTGQYALVNFKNSGAATVNLTTIITSTGCETTATYPVSVDNAIADMPASVIYFNGSFVCLQNDEVSYQWGYDGAVTLEPFIISGEINQDYVIAHPDISNKNYWVKVSHNGCTQKAYYNRPIGSTMKQSAADFTITPNPATSTTEVNIDAPGAVRMEVLNMVGQRIYEADLANNRALINVTDFSSGCYIINCYSGGVKIATKRLIKY